MPDKTNMELEGLHDYETLLPLATALDEDDVRPYRADSRLALTNVRKGTAALLGVEERIARELAALDMSVIRRAPSLALALRHAAFKSGDARNEGTDLPALISESVKLRTELLASAEPLALAGLVDATTVDDIRKGRGALDTANDCLRLAALFQENAAAIGEKTLITADKVRRAALVGSTLNSALTPTGTRRSPSEKILTASDIRDRFGTLLYADWELARKAAAWLFGTEQTEVPPLGSVARVRPREVKV